MPDPVAILPDLEQEVDVLLDVRTGYCVSDHHPAGHFDNHFWGEGNPEIFEIRRCKRREIPAQWTPWSDVGRSRIRKMDPTTRAFDSSPDKRIKDSPLSNVYAGLPQFVDGSDEDFKAAIAIYDTRQNAVRTVGTGYTFATIQASINAGASGDVSAVYGNGATPLVSGDYNENITDNALDGYQLIAMLESADGITPAIRIWNAAGTIISINGEIGWHIENFEIDGDGTGVTGFLFISAQECTAMRCVVHGASMGIYYNASRGGLVLNVAIYDCATDGLYTVNNRDCQFKHVTAVGCGNGFNESNLAADGFFACLAANNTVDFAGVYSPGCAWNVSEDLTAPGVGSRTGFNVANLANVFQLAAAGENGANIDGWPLDREDYLGNIRERDTLIFYAGAHDPYVPATGATVTCLGIIDAQPAAQGSIWIRFYEMCISGDAEPYRYDVHVKRFDNGPLTPAEIDASTYYARSFFAEEMNGCGGNDSGGSGGLPGVLQALINFEAPNDITLSVVPNDENMHLFTARQYWVCVRAVAIDGDDVVYEDTNTVVALSYSPGHQGELWTNIINCVAVEPCVGAAAAKVNVIGIPPLTVAALPPLVIGEINDEISAVIPPIDTILRAGDSPSMFGQQGG